MHRNNQTLKGRLISFHERQGWLNCSHKSLLRLWVEFKAMKPKNTESAAEYLARIGSKGGKASGHTKARSSAQARKAARARWGNPTKKGQKV